MQKYIALLRGINVGGSGVIAMKDLAEICTGLGCQSVRTYIQSGNVLFESRLSESAVRSKLEKALTGRLGKQVDVMVRTPEELRAVLKDNPFSEKEPARTGVVFLNSAPPKDLVKRVLAPGGEQVMPGKREIYIYYPDGMGQSKLKLPTDTGPGTTRNVNTVSKLLALSQA